MAFNRIGNPAKIESIDFKRASTIDIVCNHCKSIVGRRNGRFSKFTGSNAVMVSTPKFLCPKCGNATEML